MFPSVHGFFKQWLTGWTYYGSLRGCLSPCLPLERSSSQMHPTRIGAYTGAPCQQQVLAPSPVHLSHQPAGTGGSLPGASTASSLSLRTTFFWIWTTQQWPAISQPGGQRPRSAVLTPVWDAWFHPQVDLFATTFNRRLPTFVLQCQTPQLVQWTASQFHGRVFWRTPFLRSPFCRRCSRKPGRIKPHSYLLPQVASSTLVRRVALSLPCSSSLHPRALLQLSSRIAHANPGLLDLHAWLLCGIRLH